MAMHFARKPLVVVGTAHSIISRIPSLVSCAHQSLFNQSACPHTQFSLDITPTVLPTILRSYPSSKTSHCHHRWISSLTGFTCTDDVEEIEDFSDGYASDEQIYESSDAAENPTESDEDSLFNDAQTILGKIQSLSIEEAMETLDNCCLIPSSNLIQTLICRTRSNWKLAFTIFQWADAQPDYNHPVSAYHSMVSILGKHKKFNIAWDLIRDMHERGMVTRQTLIIMIRRYSAAQDVLKAIKTFHAMETFNLSSDSDAFRCLLRALCINKYVEEAEELIYLNKMYFPLETKSFNIILNAWCNIVVDVVQAKRLWKDMFNLCITPDVSSYTTIISRLSKAGNLYDVLRLYDEMKKKGCIPNLKIYNALIFVLGKGKCVKEAVNLFHKIPEMGFHPNATTYTSLIYPLCMAGKLEDAYRVLDEMIQKGFTPTIRTYHAFFRFVKNGEDIFKLFHIMIESGCIPIIETYIMSIRRCCTWGQFENAFNLWNEMEKHGFCPDHSACIFLLNGFFLNGKVEEACKYYEEMKAKGFSLEPRTDEMFEAWIAGRKYASLQLHQTLYKG
eukprot:Gb_19520 [translate_table: standard]